VRNIINGVFYYAGVMKKSCLEQLEDRPNVMFVLQKKI